METGTASEDRRGHGEDIRLAVFEMTVYLILFLGLVIAANGPVIHPGSAFSTAGAAGPVRA